MGRLFARTDAVRYANRIGLYPARRAKILGRPAHVVVAERQNVRNPDTNEENRDG